MLRELLKSKIHGATITDARLDYEGSLTVDEELLEAADILPNERINVWNITNGERLFTYAIPAMRGSGTICLNGAAAKKGSKGDLVVITAFALVSEEEAKTLKPKIIHVDVKNSIRKS